MLLLEGLFGIYKLTFAMKIRVTLCGRTRKFEEKQRTGTTESALNFRDRPSAAGRAVWGSTAGN
jgi:hypothetical protein